MSRGRLVSVILPVRNVAATVDEQLDALASQTFDGSWEVIVSDNGSTDDTVARALAWEAKLPALRVVDASERRGVGPARNVGIGLANGDVILICDGDDVVAPDWVERMTAALEEHELVTGDQDFTTLNDPRQYTWPHQAYAAGLAPAYEFLPYASGGNLGMRREVFTLLGGFDESLRRAEDVDFGWRAAYAGVEVHLEPSAVLFRRLHTRLLPLARSAFWGGLSEPLLYRRHRGRGMPREPTATITTTWWWVFMRLPAAVTGRESRFRWTFHAANRAGRVVGSVRHRTLYL